jgi:hypothetical protein
MKRGETFKSSGELAAHWRKTRGLALVKLGRTGRRIAIQAMTEVKDAVQSSDRPDAPTGQDYDQMAALSQMLGFALPVVCKVGVEHNLALLAGHWAVVRGIGEDAA